VRLHQHWTVAFVAATILAAQPSGAAIAATPSATAPSAGEGVAANFDSLVKALKGRWETLVYEEDRQGGVAAQEAADHGEQVWRTGPGGLTLMEEEHIASRGGDQYVLALHWWDRSTNTLKGMLCNNAGSGACSIDSFFRSKLNWDGKRLTVDLVFPQGTKLMLWHEEFGDFTDTSFTQTGDMGEVGGPLRRVVTIRARKVGEVN
jgi:hypothetical protein